MLIEEMRNIMFWGMDALRGHTVKNAYKQIKAIDQMSSDNSYIAKYQSKCLDALISHSCATVPYYATHGNTELQDFPVINKSIIKENQEDFFSSIYDRADLIPMLTSGSTGTPFACYQNKQKKKRVNAEIIYYSEKAGYRLGYPLIYSRSVVKQVRKNAFKQFIQNQLLYSCGDLSDAGIEQLLDKLQLASNRSILLAYASTYDAMRKYFEKHGTKKADKIHLQGLISGAEMLFDETRSSMESIFRCKCFSRYSNEEQGVIGQDVEVNNVFILNEADYIIEILDFQNDTPVAEGEIGRIVITDLYNYAMPFIRYDTGDVGALCHVMQNGVKKKAICSFSGRRVDLISDAAGNPISPHTITNAMWSFTAIRQFQLVQTDVRKYLLKLNADKSDELCAELTETLKTILGGQADISIEYIDEIPVLASGKRKYIINAIK